MFLALLRAHFNPRYARAKVILSRAKNIFMPANVNSIVIVGRPSFEIHRLMATLCYKSTFAIFVFVLLVRYRFGVLPSLIRDFYGKNRKTVAI